MILEFLGEGIINQCDQSNQAFGYVHCCGPNGVLVVDPACDSPWYPDFDRWGYECEYPDGPLNEGEVKAQIDSGRPFAFSWMSNDSTGSPTASGAQTVQQVDRIAHLLVVIGYGKDIPNNVPVIVCLDPCPFRQTGMRIVPLHDYNGSSGDYTHVEGYVSIQRKNNL